MTEVEQRVLEAVVRSVVDRGQGMSGRRLRADLRLGTRDEVRDALLSLCPKLLTWNGEQVGDNYSITLDGLLAVEGRERCETILEHVLLLWRQKFAADPDFEMFTWAEVCEGGRLARSDFAITERLLSHSRLTAGGTGSSGVTPDEPKHTWRTCADIEELLDAQHGAALLATGIARAAEILRVREETERIRREGEREYDQKFGILWAPRQLVRDLESSLGISGCAVLYMDLDHFKQINDRFTERVVDVELLPDLQHFIRAHCEPHGSAYLEGGDEMVVLLRNTTPRVAEAFADSLVHAIEERKFIVAGEPVKVTASVGLACAELAEDLLKLPDQANLAKREAKTNGRNRVVVFGRADQPSWAAEFECAECGERGLPHACLGSEERRPSWRHDVD